MKKKFYLIGKEEQRLTDTTFHISFEDNDVLELSFIPKEKDHADDGVLIHDYHLIELEDGIFQVIFPHEGNTYIIDLNLYTKNAFRICSDEYKTGSLSYTSAGNRPITNQEKAVDFWLRFFDKHDETAIDDYLSDPYIQHNPTVKDGIKAFYDEFHERFKTDMKECTTKIKHVSSRGDLVFIHNILKRSPEVRGHAAVDIFRFENGRIVEHWDVIQKMPESSVNEHPMF